MGGIITDENMIYTFDTSEHGITMQPSFYRNATGKLVNLTVTEFSIEENLIVGRGFTAQDTEVRFVG
ncbi:MAG: hypothetical protein ACKO96_44590 [Flammeovirgaceae bacterium]